MRRQRLLGLVVLALLAGCGKAPLNTVSAQQTGPTGRMASMAGAEMLDADDHYAYERRAPQPTPPGRQGDWLLFTNHNHSTYWDGKKPLTWLQQQAYLTGFDAMALTDHDTMIGSLSPEFKHPAEPLIMVKGMEWNAFRELGQAVVGHAGILGMDGTDNIDPGASLDEMLTQATARHATIIINHPFCRNNTWKQPEPDLRAAGVEVWNSFWYLADHWIQNEKALDWWDAALKKGRHLTAVAGTDSHGEWFMTVARNANMVFATTPDERGILEGIRAGHNCVLASPSSARVYLEADYDGDGVFERMMGDSVPATTKLAVRARVLGGAGKKVVFYTSKGRASIVKVESQDATIPFTATLNGVTDYVRCELRTHPNLVWSMTAISNPIYVGGASK